MEIDVDDGELTLGLCWCMQLVFRCEEPYRLIAREEMEGMEWCQLLRRIKGKGVEVGVRWGSQEKDDARLDYY